VNALRRCIRRDAGDREAGFTLTEMLVSAIIIAMISAMVSVVVVTTVRQTQVTATRNTQGNQARVAMEAISKALRTTVVPIEVSDNCALCTNAFIQGTASSLSFYADINNPGGIIGPSEVAFTVSASGVLTETIQPPNANTVVSGNFAWTGQNDPTCTPGAVGCLKKVTFLASGVKTTTPLFTYYPYGTTTPETTIAAADLSDIDSIDVQITVQLPNRPVVVPTVLVERIALSNIDVYVQEQS
jgi:prepilin-type N-terminal cleavage/methylation domain-containing protein